MKPETKREVLIAREAYLQRARDDYHDTGWMIYGPDITAKAAKLFPLPTRPRVVEFGIRRQYKYEGGEFYVRALDHVPLGWVRLTSIGPSELGKLEFLLELAKNPSEEVEDVG